MSGYRYPFGGDGRRPHPGPQYYEHLRHEPTTRPVSAPGRAVNPSSKPVLRNEMNPPPQSELVDREVRQDERDDIRTHREMADPNHLVKRLSGANPVPVPPEARHVPSMHVMGHLEEQQSLQYLSRRATDMQYEAWLKTKSVYPSGARPRPPQMRSSYPTDPAASRAHRILEHAQRTQGVRDMDILEHEMRNRIAASVLGDAPLGQATSFSQPRGDYRGSYVARNPPKFDREGPLRHDQVQGVGSKNNAARESHDVNQEKTQDPPVTQTAKTESEEISSFTNAEKEKRPASDASGAVAYDRSDAYDVPPPKRQKQIPPPSHRPDTGMLDLLCSATLEVGPLKDHPSTGCSCSKSHCIKLYCDCFKARRHCTDICACANCKNTAEESGVDGALTKAIRATLSRNPHAFKKTKKETVEPSPGELVCRCVKSKCLKLYCDCFQGGQVCGVACSCSFCLNTTEESKPGGRRDIAIRQCLEKRPDAFEKKVKEVGSGCACKNNRCLKKYCDCFRFNLSCSERCSCKDCENMGTNSAIRKNAQRA